MLEEILDSKIDSAVLGFFLSMPERAFGSLEVARRLGQPRLKTARTLSKLSNGGFLRVFTKRGKKYYLVDSKYKLLPEIKSYWLRAGAKVDDELFLAIKRLGKVRAAFLSGIFCGLATLPVDILLVGRINLQKLSEFLKTVQKMMGQEINYSIMSVEEFLERRDTFDKFIKDIFDYRHLTVVDQLAGKKRR